MAPTPADPLVEALAEAIAAAVLAELEAEEASALPELEGELA